MLFVPALFGAEVSFSSSVFFVRLGFDLVVVVFLSMLVNLVTYCLFNRLFVRL